MSSKSCERIKRQICDELSQRRLSISHDRWHLERVLAFAQQLQAIYGGDIEVLTAASLLHDLGRTDTNLHGRASVDKSVEEARKVLDIVDMSPSKIQRVIVAISEHDQAELVPSTTEGKILKEADFLAGFGAWGILRIAMWAAETDQGVDQILDRLGNRMPIRLDSLQFPESRRLARREMLFSDIFLSRLKQPPVLDGRPGRGKYIVLEGISGSGKDTQAGFLVPRLQELGHRVLMVREPTDTFRKARTLWGSAPWDPVIELFLLLADRYELVTRKVLPALVRGDIVVSVRSFLSTLVHQQQPLYNPAAIALMHAFVPPAHLVILYDVDADTAYERCLDRAQAAKTHLSIHEDRAALERHRRLYLDLLDRLPSLDEVVIDASQSIHEIADLTWDHVEADILCLEH